MGCIISLYGLTQTPAQVYYVIGSSLLLFTAIHFKLFYFIALELILLAGHGSILLNIGPVLPIALPVLLCVQLLFFYYVSGRLNNMFVIIGVLGIAVHSIGLSYENQWVFFAGSSAVAIYALHNMKKHRVSLLWAVLNILFALSVMIKMYMT